MFEQVKVYVVEIASRPTYQLRWQDPVTQRKRTKSTTIRRAGSRARKAAERLAAELATQIMTGAGGIPSRLRWEEFRERYEREVLPGLAAATAGKVSTIFDRLEVDISPARLWDVNEGRISAFAAGLRSSGLKENTVASYLAHLKAALGWAVDQKLLPARPAFPKVHRAKRLNGRPMKGRPITSEEFERMLAVVPEVVGDAAVGEWQRYLRGLWVSGLRLTESLELWWDRPDKLYPEFPREGRPMLRIPCELEKGNTDRLLPIAPEFALFLQEVPDGERTGPVFRLTGQRRGQPDQLKPHRVSVIVSRIGKAAGVKVYVDPKNPAKVKYASAHDLRRAFGERWSLRLMPAQLMELMRHESIETTLRFYVGTDAQRTADAAWAAFDRDGGAETGRFGSALGSAPPQGPGEPVAEDSENRGIVRRKRDFETRPGQIRTGDQGIMSPDKG